MHSSGRAILFALGFMLAHIADDVAYGAGVWTGCLSSRSAAPLRPRLVRHPFRNPG